MYNKEAYLRYVFVPGEPHANLRSDTINDAMLILANETPYIMADLMSGRHTVSDMMIVNAVRRMNEMDASTRTFVLKYLKMEAPVAAATYFLMRSYTRALEMYKIKYENRFCVGMVNPDGSLECPKCGVKGLKLRQKQLYSYAGRGHSKFFGRTSQNGDSDVASETVLHNRAGELSVEMYRLIEGEPLWEMLTAYSEPQKCACGAIIKVNVITEASNEE